MSTVATYLAVYFVVWWISLFLVLPFGVRNQVDVGEVVPGSEPGAPVNSLWKRHMVWTTLLSIPLTMLLVWAVSLPWLHEYWS